MLPDAVPTLSSELDDGFPSAPTDPGPVELLAALRAPSNGLDGRLPPIPDPPLPSPVAYPLPCRPVASAPFPFHPLDW